MNAVLLSTILFVAATTGVGVGDQPAPGSNNAPSPTVPLPDGYYRMNLSDPHQLMVANTYARLAASTFPDVQHPGYLQRFIGVYNGSSKFITHLAGMSYHLQFVVCQTTCENTLENRNASTDRCPIRSCDYAYCKNCCAKAETQKTALRVLPHYGDEMRVHFASKDHTGLERWQNGTMDIFQWIKSQHHTSEDDAGGQHSLTIDYSPMDCQVQSKPGAAGKVVMESSWVGSQDVCLSICWQLKTYGSQCDFVNYMKLQKKCQILVASSSQPGKIVRYGVSNYVAPTKCSQREPPLTQKHITLQYGPMNCEGERHADALYSKSSNAGIGLQQLLDDAVMMVTELAQSEEVCASICYQFQSQGYPCYSINYITSNDGSKCELLNIKGIDGANKLKQQKGSVFFLLHQCYKPQADRLPTDKPEVSKNLENMNSVQEHKLESPSSQPDPLPIAKPEPEVTKNLENENSVQEHKLESPSSQPDPLPTAKPEPEVTNNMEKTNSVQEHKLESPSSQPDPLPVAKPEVTNNLENANSIQEHKVESPSCPHTSSTASHSAPKPKVGPFREGKLDNPVQSGQTLVIKGVPSGQKFDINLAAGGNYYCGDDVGLHFSWRKWENEIVLNSLENGGWKKEQRYWGGVIQNEKPFDVRIRVHDDHFEIFVDEKKLADFNHRVSLSILTHVFLAGDVRLHSLAWEGNYYSMPYRSGFPRNFIAGKKLSITGLTDKYANGFAINFYAGNYIAFHYNVRLNEKVIVCNSHQGGNWGQEQRDWTVPFARNTQFDVVIRSEGNAMQVYVNGQHHCTFRNRIPAERIDGLGVTGDMQLLSIAFD